MLVPQAWAPLLAVAVALAAAVAVLVRGNPGDPWTGAVTLAGVALLIATPTYPVVRTLFLVTKIC